MGGGSWTTSSYNCYIGDSRGISATDFTTASMSTQEVFRQHRLSEKLRPLLIVRECCDSEEHPNTFPVILALDVTGSMGGASVKVAQKLNDIMTSLYDNSEIKDIEFCIMGIGDLSYDDAPIQMSQFESDIRIAEQLDEIYFEAGGGGNSFESYTAAWYMGLYHCKLDCWKRGQKGIIITMGDELPNPYLPKKAIKKTVGDNLQEDVNTDTLIKEVKEKFDIYHISIDDRDTCYSFYKEKNIDEKWEKLLGKDNYKIAGLDNLATTITDIITKKKPDNVFNTSCEEVSW